MRQLFLLLVLITLISCKDHALTNSQIFFTSPQPQNINAVTQVPENYQGRFSLNFNESIIVNAKSILRETTEDFFEKRTTLDSLNLSYKNGYVIEHGTGLKHEASVKNDSIYWKVKTIDTLFSFAPHEILKVYKSSLILNKEIDDLYQVNILSFNTTFNKYLQLGTLKDAEKIEKKLNIPREVLLKEQDTLHVVLNPTRADFRKLLRMKDFEYETYYLLK